MATSDEMQAITGIDPSTIKEDAWEFVSRDDTTETQRYWVESPRPGFGGISIERKVYLDFDTFAETNKMEFEDGRGMLRDNGTYLDAKVADIPLEVFYNEIVPKVHHDGDKDYLKHWLSKDENKVYKTQKGSW